MHHPHQLKIINAAEGRMLNIYHIHRHSTQTAVIKWVAVGIGLDYSDGKIIPINL